MSEKKCSVARDKKRIIVKGPLLLKKDNIKFRLNTTKPKSDVFLKQVQSIYREDVIYESPGKDFLQGESHKLILLNRLNKLTNSCRTIAKYVSQSDVVTERTSDNLVKLIGQKNYDTVFSTLLSVINQEQKIKSMLALLTIPKTDLDFSNEKSPCDCLKKKYKAISCQTEESYMEHYRNSQIKPKRRHRRQKVTPYVVKEPLKVNRVIKKIIIHPEDLNNPNLADEGLSSMKSNTEVIKIETQENDETLVDNKSPISTEIGIPDTKIFNEDSLLSDGNSSIAFSDLSITDSQFSVINRCIAPVDSLESDQCQPTTLKMSNGLEIQVPFKPVDMFHIATKKILKQLPRDEQRKLGLLQGFIDLKFCLIPNEDDKLPIHIAVLNNDIELLRRQCSVLKQMPEETVDTISFGISALQLALAQDAMPGVTKLLLWYGADPLRPDVEGRTALHLAAELAHPLHLHEVLDYMRTHAREILEDNQELWKPGMEKESDEQLAQYLLHEACTMTEEQGYTALMLASRRGRAQNVAMLAKAAPRSVHARAAGCGSTALHLAVQAACLDAAGRSNKSQVSPEFVSTLEALLEAGAEPGATNFAGADVGALLADGTAPAVAALLANKLVGLRYLDSRPASSLMLYKLSEHCPPLIKNITDKKDSVEAESCGSPLPNQKTTEETENNSRNQTAKVVISESSKSDNVSVHLQDSKMVDGRKVFDSRINNVNGPSSLVINNALRNMKVVNVAGTTVVDKASNIIISKANFDACDASRTVLQKVVGSNGAPAGAGGNAAPSFGNYSNKNKRKDLVELIIPNKRNKTDFKLT